MAEPPSFETVVARVLRSLPPESEGPPESSLSGQIRRKLEKLWANPRVAALEACLGRALATKASGSENDDEAKRIEARAILFYPNAKEASLYPLLLTPPPDEAPEDHPQRGLQMEGLTLLYLLHVPYGRGFGTNGFVRPFILAGGLEALAAFLTSPNLFLRGQAVDALMQLTGGGDGFDWWALKHGHHKETGFVLSSDDEGLHNAMLKLQHSDAWLPGLILNSDAAQSYPGGPLQTLQLTAFWLSWARTFYAREGRRIHCSRSLLAALREWGDVRNLNMEQLVQQQLQQQPSNSAAVDKLIDEQNDGIDLHAPPSSELLRLRCQLWEDFGREDAIEGAEAEHGFRHVQGLYGSIQEVVTLRQRGQLNQASTAIIEVDAADGVTFDLDASPPPPPSGTAVSETCIPPPSPVATTPAPRDIASIFAAPTKSARELGNEAFAAGRLEEALDHYDRALQEILGGDGEKNEKRAGEAAVIECNRATVFWTMCTASSGSSSHAAKADGTDVVSSNQFPSLVTQCVLAARRAIEMDNGYHKAHYRLAQALELQGDFHGAIRAAEDALRVADRTVGSSGKIKPTMHISMANRRARAVRGAIEKLTVKLMERLALDTASHSSALSSSSSSSSGFSTSKEAGQKSDPKHARLEREARLMSKILRRKEVAQHHDYLVDLSGSSEAAALLDDDAPPDLQALADDGGKPTSSNSAVQQGFLNKTSLLECDETDQNERVPIVIVDDDEEDDEESSVEISDEGEETAMVLSNQKKKSALTDAVINELAATEVEKLTRAMLESSKDEDSDDDDVILRKKRAVERALQKSKAKAASKKKNKGGQSLQGNASAVGEATAAIRLGEKDAKAKAAEAALTHTVRASKGVSKSAAKKADLASTAAALSSSDMSSTQKARKLLKQKKEKKSQLEDLRKMANSTTAFFFD